MWKGPACLLLATAFACCGAFAQSKALPAKARVAVSFFRLPVSDLSRFPQATHFVDALRELGWVEGKQPGDRLALVGRGL